MTQYELNIRDFWRIVRKRKLIISIITILLAFLSLSFTYYNRPAPIFQSIASVKIQRSTNLSGLYMESLTWNPEDNISTQAEVIRSFPIMQKVAQKLGYLDSTLTVDEILSDENAVSIILSLMGHVGTEQEGLTNIINIVITSGNPDATQVLANTIASVYIAENHRERNQRAVNALQFIEKQLQSVGDKLRETEEEVRKYRESEKVISLDSKTAIISRRLEVAQDEYDRIIRRREEVEITLKKIKKEDSNELLNSFIGLNSEFQSPTYYKLTDRLAELFLQRDQLLINFTKNHPDVIQLNNQVQQVLGNIQKELKAQYTSLSQLMQIQKDVLDQLKSEFQTLPRDGLELARLQRKLQLHEEIYTLLESKHQEALLQNAEKIKEASLVKPALRGYQINNPPSAVNTFVLGGIVGLILGLLGAFIYESLDTSFETIEEVEKSLELPVLGIIPHYDENELVERFREENNFKGSERSLRLNAKLISFFSPKSSLAESYRALRTNIHYLKKINGLKTVLVTSSTTGEGKTTTISNLAIAMSQIGLKTLLIDCDLRRPAVDKTFGITREPGLSNILMDTAEWQDCIQTITDIMMGALNLDDVMLAPGMDNLHILTAGISISTPAELMNSSKLSDLLNEMKEHYDIILLDSAPVLPAADATILASWVDGVILVYKVGRTARGALRRTKTQLETVNAKINGIVINNFKVEFNPEYKDLRYNKYYSYGADMN